MKARWYLAALAVPLAGVAVWLWGAGAFGPCERLGGLLGGTACSRLALFEGESVEAILPRGEGLLLVTRAKGTEPARPQDLVRLDGEGQELERTPLAALDPKPGVMSAALSPDGSRLALSALNEPVRVLDAASGALLATLPPHNAGTLRFVDDATLYIHRGEFPDGMPSATTVRAFSLAGPEPVEIAPDPALAAGLLDSGVSAAVSADGQLSVQQLAAPRDGTAAVRLWGSEHPRQVNRLLSTRLAADCDYIMPLLAFSPDGSRLAVSFNCFLQSWGAENSALLVYDTASGEALLRLPSRDQLRSLTWLPDGRTLLAERFDSDDGESDDGELFRIAVP